MLCESLSSLNLVVPCRGLCVVAVGGREGGRERERGGGREYISALWTRLLPNFLKLISTISSSHNHFLTEISSLRNKVGVAHIANLL